METMNRRKMPRMGAMLAISLIIMSFATLPGGHTYRIYINNKLILDRAVSHGNQPVYLTLTQKNYNDKIDVYYNHCGQVGTARHLIIRDENNKLIKDFKFADASGSNAMMSFAAKDLISLQTDKAGKLGMYYTSKETPQATLLATVVKGNMVSVASAR